MHELGVGRERDVLGLNGRVDSDPREVSPPQGATVMGYPQALGQQQLELIAQPLAPMAEPRALMREGVLEELLAGEVLEVWAVGPARTYLLVRQGEDMLEHQQADHEPRLNRRTAVGAVERGDLAVDPGPVDLAGELHQLVLHVDDLLEPGPEQIIRLRRLALLGSHPEPSDARSESRDRLAENRQKRNRKIRPPHGPEPCDFKTALNGDFRLTFKRLRDFHGRRSKGEPVRRALAPKQVSGGTAGGVPWPAWNGVSRRCGSAW